MSFSIDAVVRAWSAAHEAPVEEAFSDFLVVGLSGDDVKYKVPYVVQVDGTVAFGEEVPVDVEEVEMSDLTRSEQLELAVGEVGLGTTIVSLAQSDVDSYVRRSKSGKMVRVKRHWRMFQRDRKAVERARSAAQKQYDKRMARGEGSDFGPDGPRAEYLDTVMKAHAKTKKPGRIATALRTIAADMKDQARSETLAHAGVPSAEQGRIAYSDADLDAAVLEQTIKRSNRRSESAAKRPSQGRPLPPNGDFSKWSDADLEAELEVRQRDVGRVPGAEGPRDELLSELTYRRAVSRGLPVSAAPFPTTNITASQIKPHDLISLDDNVRLVTAVRPQGDDMVLRTTTPRGGDAQTNTVKKISTVKKLTIGLTALLLTIGAGNAGEHHEYEYHPHESITQTVEGRTATEIAAVAPPGVSSPSTRITAERPSSRLDNTHRIGGVSQADDEREWEALERARDDEVEFIAEDDPMEVEARKLVGKVTTDGGFTYNPRTSTYVEHGFAVAMPGNSKIIKDADFTGDAAVEAVIAYLDEHEDKVFSNGRIQVGGWHDTEHGEVVLDLSEIFEDQIEAMKAGVDRDEQAIFDLDTFTEIPTGGTGGRVDLSMLVDEYLALADGSIPLSSANYVWEEGA